MLATDLRKNLFQSLDKAAQGQAVFIEYKGVSLRLEAVGDGSKLAYAMRRNAIMGDPDALIGPDRDLMDGLNAKWANEDLAL